MRETDRTSLEVRRFKRKRLVHRVVWLFLLTQLTLSGWCGLYVTTDGYKILPNGKILEFDHHPPELFKKENLIWNASEKTIRISGARNETVAFQIIIDGPLTRVALESEPLSGPVEFPSSSVTFHLEGFVSYRGKLYPDILIPFNTGIFSSFSIPYQIDGLPTLSEQKVGVILVEIAIPAHIPAGEYTSRVLVKGDLNGALNLCVTVFDFALPPAPSFLLEFNSYSSPVSAVLNDQRSPYRPTPARTIEAEHEFYRCASQHRAYLNIIPVHSQRGRPRYAPMLRGKGQSVQCDWTYWDQRFGPVLDGSIFKNKIPPQNFYLPFNLHWPWGYSHNKDLEDRRLNWREKPEYANDHTLLITQDYLDEWEAVARQTISHFVDRNWTGTTYQVYLNHTNQPNSNSPWRLDEPYDRWDFEVLSYFAKLVDSIFENDQGLKVRYRLDIGHFYCRTPTTQCYKAKRYDLPLLLDGGGRQLLEPVVDHWYINASHVWGNREMVTNVGNKDSQKEMFVYGGGQRVFDSSTLHRSLFWYLYDFKMRGYCSWNQGCTDPELPLEKPGARHVWYSGKKLGYNGPLPSLRMKQWRRGSYDAEYLKLAETKTSRKQIISTIVRILCNYKKSHPKYKYIDFPYPNNNPYNYEIARLKLASMIVGKNISSTQDFLGRIPGTSSNFVDQIKNY